MVAARDQFNLMPWDGPRLAGELPYPLSRITVPPFPLLESYKAKGELAMIDLKRLFGAMSLPVTPGADFRRMLEWKLLRGSHEFPGPDGGTCVNEAAMVVAGYPYRAVYSVKDLPASFSRPIAMLALCLNDTLEDGLRQELLAPFVTRLAGSADTPEVEMMRAQLIHQRIVSEILLPAVMRHGNAELAGRCRSLGTPADLAELTGCLRFGGHHRALPRSLIAAVGHAADAAVQGRSGQLTELVFCTFLAVRHVAALDADDRGRNVYRQVVKILEAATAIGNQAEANGVDIVRERMKAAKRPSNTARTPAHRGDVLAA
jgi:hypothetical protein